MLRVSEGSCILWVVRLDLCRHAHKACAFHPHVGARPLDPPRLRGGQIQEQPLHYLHLSTLREYLRFEFADLTGLDLATDCAQRSPSAQCSGRVGRRIAASTYDAVTQRLPPHCLCHELLRATALLENMLGILGVMQAVMHEQERWHQRS